MKKICLVRTDLHQELEVTVDFEDLTTEKTIGRGIFLRCDDKRVSRNHCSLRVVPDGGILLVARHTNPCYYKLQSQSAIFTLLSMNDSITLHEGDEFALLPESFRYRISMVQEQNGASDPNEEEPTNEVLDATENCVNNSEEVDNRCVDATNETSPVLTSVIGECPPVRVLPDWLINLPQSNVTTPLTIARKRKTEQQKYLMDKKQKNAFNETCRGSTNVPDEQTLGVQETESNDSPSVLDTEITETGVPSISSLPEPAAGILPVSAQCAQSNSKEGYEESWGDSGLARVKIEPGIETQVDNEPVENPVMIKKEQIKKEPVKEEPADDTSNPASVNQGASCSNTDAPAATAAAATREMCIYGLACFRRNPQHRADLSHPGDADYDADAENLPECEYGTSCYRKNVQHRKDFKHTKKMSPPPQPSPRPPQANNPARLGDTSEEDEYDLNDSFLNDASSDDYQPSGSSETDDDSDEIDSSQADSQPTPEKKKKRKLRKAK